jgi:hypothetical protein
MNNSRCNLSAQRLESNMLQSSFTNGITGRLNHYEVKLNRARMLLDLLLEASQKAAEHDLLLSIAMSEQVTRRALNKTLC